MKTLVIGHTGQLARALVELCGTDVVAVGRPAVDITNVASLMKVIQAIRPGIVVNAAAYTSVDAAESEAKVCADHGVPLIHISTDYVFDGRLARPYHENDHTAPINVYGASKRAGEHAVSAHCPQHIILRTSWVHSPWGNNFVRTMLRLAATRREISVVDDQHGSPTFAPHLATAVLAVVRNVESNAQNVCWGTYHVCGNESTTWWGYAREIFRVAKRCGLPTVTVNAITTAEYPTAARRPANSQLDTAKFTQQFGCVMPNWQDGTAMCVTRIAQKVTT
jgi:dTDP-4-dehydrorhamnose reductase